MRAQLEAWRRALPRERLRRPRSWYLTAAVIRVLAALLVCGPLVLQGPFWTRAGMGASLLSALTILGVLVAPWGRRLDRYWAVPPVIDTLFILLTLVVAGGVHSPLGWIVILHAAAMGFLYGGGVGAIAGSVVTLAVAGMVVAEPLAPRASEHLTYLLMMWGAFGVVTYLSETSERHRRSALEQEQRAQELETLSRAKQQFIHIASHELRTPLTVIKGYNALMQALLKRGADPELASYSLEIGRAADRMGLLIDELMDFGRMQSGQLPLNLEAFAFERLASDVIKVLGVLAGQRDQRLLLEVEGPCSPLGADPRRLEQVLINLLRNALKYSPERTAVTLRVRYLPGLLRVEVEDQGVGIAAEHMPHLFTPFYRAHPDQDGTEGVGLGLAICHGIVQAHGGRIGAQSTPGQGSTFWFELPQRAEALGVTRAEGARA